MISTSRVYAMLGNENLWETAAKCHQLLGQAGIPHAIVEGVAVCLHGYRRNSVDVDILVRPADADSIRNILTGAGMSWDVVGREFKTASGIPVQLLFSGERAGKLSEVLLPDPGELAMITERDGLPVLALARLIETKLACGEGNVRRTHKDFADVVELIAANQLDRSFARFLHKSLRKTYRQLVEHARGAP